MAIILTGQTRCGLCNELIEESDPTVAFPAFIVNEADPLFLFSDAAFHESCFLKHPLSKEVMQLYNKWLSETGPGNRKCAVCGEEITDPDDYVLIDHLTHQPSSPSFKYNFTHLHRSHLNDWPDRLDLIDLLEGHADLEDWKGEYLKDLVATLKDE